MITSTTFMMKLLMMMIVVDIICIILLKNNKTVNRNRNKINEKIIICAKDKLSGKSTGLKFLFKFYQFSPKAT